jgi:hypothetical protein
VEETTEAEYKPAAGAISFFVRDTSGNLISQRSRGADGVWRSPRVPPQRVGSVVGLVDNTGNKVNSYRYDHLRQTDQHQRNRRQPMAVRIRLLRRLHQSHQVRHALLRPLPRPLHPARPPSKDPHDTYTGCDPVNRVDPTGGTVYVHMGGSLTVGAFVVGG